MLVQGGGGGGCMQHLPLQSSGATHVPTGACRHKTLVAGCAAMWARGPVSRAPPLARACACARADALHARYRVRAEFLVLLTPVFAVARTSASRCFRLRRCACDSAHGAVHLYLSVIVLLRNAGLNFHHRKHRGRILFPTEEVMVQPCHRSWWAESTESVAVGAARDGPWGGLAEWPCTQQPVGAQHHRRHAAIDLQTAGAGDGAVHCQSKGVEGGRDGGTDGRRQCQPLELCERAIPQIWFFRF